MTQIKAEDIKIFSDAAIAFFLQTTGLRAQVSTAYIVGGDKKIAWSDYQSRIDLGGKYEGMVTFSAPRALLTSVLLRMGENDHSHAIRNDITGEIANQMSGYVRQHFGEGMKISAPTVLSLDDTFLNITQENDSFVIPMSWDGYEAKLFVSIRKIV